MITLMKVLLPTLVVLVACVLGATFDHLIFTPPPVLVRTALSKEEQFRTAVDFLQVPTASAAERDDRYLQFFYALRRLGAEGVRMVGNYLQSGQDRDLHRDWTFTAYGGVLEPPTLRLALLQTLEKWPRDGVLGINEEVLRHTSSTTEACLALRNIWFFHDERDTADIERREFGPLFGAVLHRAPPTAEEWDVRCCLDVLRFTGSPELIPLIEQRVMLSSDPDVHAAYLDILRFVLPRAARYAAEERLLGLEAVTAELARCPAKLGDLLDFTSPVVRTKVAVMFSQQWDQQQRHAFLVALPDSMTEWDSTVGFILRTEMNELWRAVQDDDPGGQERGKLELLSLLEHQVPLENLETFRASQASIAKDEKLLLESAEDAKASP